MKERFDAYFVKRKNVIFERARFNQRKQKEGKTLEAFIVSLHKLAEHCNYWTMIDEMIRDRLVVVLQDVALSRKLQLEAELTLDSAMTTARQTEEVKSEQAELRNDSSSTVEAVHKASARETGSTTRSQRSTCTRCGRALSHEFQQCPARNKICRKCHKQGHFQACCRNPQHVADIQQGMTLTFS